MTITLTSPEAVDTVVIDTASPKLLVIDDDPDFVRLMELRFRDYEITLLAAFHGMHGIWVAASEKPNLILTDVRMPQGEGSYVIDCLRQRTDTARIPVIVVTGMRDHDLHARLLRLGAEKVLHKPVLFDELLGEVANFIDLRKRA